MANIDYETVIENVDGGYETIFSLGQIALSLKDARKSGCHVLDYDKKLECLITQIIRTAIYNLDAINVALGRDCT